MSLKRMLVDTRRRGMLVERFGWGRPLLSAAVLLVLKSSMICPFCAIFDRCKLRVLLHAAITVVFRAMHFQQILYRPKQQCVHL